MQSKINLTGKLYAFRSYLTVSSARAQWECQLKPTRVWSVSHPEHKYASIKASYAPINPACSKWTVLVGNAISAPCLAMISLICSSTSSLMVWNNAQFVVFVKV